MGKKNIFSFFSQSVISKPMAILCYGGKSPVMLRAEWCKQLWAATSVTDSMGAEFDFWDMFWLANNLGNTENSISSTQEKFLNRHHCVHWRDRLWICVCILLTNGVDARVVTSFAQGLCAQEYLIKLPCNLPTRAALRLAAHEGTRGDLVGAWLPEWEMMEKIPSSCLCWLLSSCCK